MTATEAVTIAAGNLWRLRARAALTVSGVAIGIGALVSMLSLSSGIQGNIRHEFRRFGLLETIHVMPGKDGSGPVLDRTTLAAIAALPGVTTAYPQVSFDAAVNLDGADLKATVQGLPADLVRRQVAEPMAAGHALTADDAAEALVSVRWAEQHDLDPAQLVGRRLTLDATGMTETVVAWVVGQLQQLGLPAAVIGAARAAGLELAESIRPSRAVVTVVGVAELDGGMGMRRGDIVVPIDVAEGVDHLSVSDPVELMARMSSPGAPGWRRIVVLLDRQDDAAAVRAAVEGMGLRTFSFLDEFAEMRRFFRFFNGLIAALGLMALCIASLGIVNTMLMSILERTREIGILKSLGGDEREIRLLFLAEAALIGVAGSLAGVALGWAVSRAMSRVLRWWMVNQGGPSLDMFALTVTTVLAAMALGVGVSVVAGLYPAARAARVDPVRALRAE